MMATSSSYGDPDNQLGAGSAGIYVQNGATPPAQQQQQQQHMHTDPELQLRENMQQLQQGTEMLHAAPQAHQMGGMNPVHHHFQTPPRPAHSPQHMAQSAQSVMGMEEHNPYGDHDSASRKRSKVSRACDECRRKKVRPQCVCGQGALLTAGRFDATRPVRTDQKLVQAASGPQRDVSLAGSR
jgi:hypothetical protein